MGFEKWDVIEFQKWCREKLPNIEFDTTCKDRSGTVRSYFKEDYELQAQNILNDISFPSLLNTFCHYCPNVN